MATAVKTEEPTALQDIYAEYLHARKLFPKMASAHEGIAVIREEYLELESAVFWSPKNHPNTRIEAVQLGAMALRFIIDICDAEESR